jgi:hypothetical protein
MNESDEQSSIAHLPILVSFGPNSTVSVAGSTKPGIIFHQGLQWNDECTLAEFCAFSPSISSLARASADPQTATHGEGRGHDGLPLKCPSRVSSIVKGEPSVPSSRAETLAVLRPILANDVHYRRKAN